MKHATVFVTIIAAFLVLAASAVSGQELETGDPGDVIVIYDRPQQVGYICEATFINNESIHLGNVARLESGLTLREATNFEAGPDAPSGVTLTVVSEGQVTASIVLGESGGTSATFQIHCGAPPAATATVPPVTAISPPATTTPPAATVPPTADPCPADGLACTGGNNTRSLAITAILAITLGTAARLTIRHTR